ncbi:MAG: DUF4286 family protein [Bacteroidota bacterium]
MVVYSVTTSVMYQREEEWVKWMKEEHIPQVLATGYFTGHEFHKLVDPQPEAGAATYNVQYLMESFTDYHHYQEKAAPALRKDHEEAFGKSVLSFRTVLKRIT